MNREEREGPGHQGDLVLPDDQGQGLLIDQERTVEKGRGHGLQNLEITSGISQQMIRDIMMNIPIQQNPESLQKILLISILNIPKQLNRVATWLCNKLSQQNQWRSNL